MRRLIACAILAAVVLAGAPVSAADRAGDFDYYVLALGWNAAWCATTGDAREADQCDPRHDHAFLLHGLWPQRERGWPQDCPTPHRDPTWDMAAAMADIMGSGGLARYQWRKHGTCSDLSPARYFALSRQAFERIRQPDLLRAVTRPLRIDPEVVEQAFLAVNPDLGPADLGVGCARGLIAEVRICLTRTLDPRPCSADAVRDCRGPAVLEPVR